MSEMETYVATIAVGPGTDGNTYLATFEADDLQHALEQAEDHVRDAAVEWVVGVEKYRGTPPLEAIGRILDYGWASEQRDYEEAVRNGDIEEGSPLHIFTHMRTVRAWLAGKEESDEAPSAAGVG